MSKSYRTLPPRLLALKNFLRDREEAPIWPRVIERTPRPGDIHPLTASDLLAVIPRMPISYLYGLQRIELRPRVSDVGSPFGKYRVADKSIILYSLPLGEWEFKNYNYYGWMYSRYGAELHRKNHDLLVRWLRPEYLACFMYEEVFLHELGHHRDYQYPCRHKVPGSKNSREYSANDHAILLARHKPYEAMLKPIEGEPLPGGA